MRGEKRGTKPSEKQVIQFHSTLFTGTFKNVSLQDLEQFLVGLGRLLGLVEFGVEKRREVA